MDSSGKSREREMRVTVLDNVVLGLSDSVSPPPSPAASPAASAGSLEQHLDSHLTIMLTCIRRGGEDQLECCRAQNKEAKRPQWVISVTGSNGYYSLHTIHYTGFANSSYNLCCFFLQAVRATLPRNRHPSLARLRRCFRKKYWWKMLPLNPSVLLIQKSHQ